MDEKRMEYRSAVVRVFLCVSANPSKNSYVFIIGFADDKKKTRDKFSEK